MEDFGAFKEALRALVDKFERDKNHYLQKGYPEAQLRVDFLNPFFAALGWDIENRSNKPPHERDVLIEVQPEATRRADANLRPDYSFDLHKKKAALPQSAEREKIEREIAVTEEKIDEVVCGLYGVTEKERQSISV